MTIKAMQKVQGRQYLYILIVLSLLFSFVGCAGFTAAGISNNSAQDKQYMNSVDNHLRMADQYLDSGKSLDKAQDHVDYALALYNKVTPAGMSSPRGVTLAAQIAAKQKAVNAAQANNQEE